MRHCIRAPLPVLTVTFRHHFKFSRYSEQLHLLLDVQQPFKYWSLTALIHCKCVSVPTQISTKTQTKTAKLILAIVRFFLSFYSIPKLFLPGFTLDVQPQLYRFESCAFKEKINKKINQNNRLPLFWGIQNKMNIGDTDLQQRDLLPQEDIVLFNPPSYVEMFILWRKSQLFTEKVQFLLALGCYGLRLWKLILY